MTDEANSFVPMHAAHADAEDPAIEPQHTAAEPGHVVPDFLAGDAPEHARDHLRERAAGGAGTVDADGNATPVSSAAPSDTADLIAAAQAAAAQAQAGEDHHSHAVSGALGSHAAPSAPDQEPEPADAEDHVPPSTTAEIDVAAVEARLKDPGSTQSFEPITDDQLIETDSTYDAGTTTTLMWGARSDVGCVRSHNEDSYLVKSPLFAVCDGMGGHAAGEVASSIAVETIAKTAPHTADAQMLGAAVEAANAAVIEAATNGLGKPGMGCTATTAYIEGSTVAIAHVGDSRAYMLHEGSLIRLTRDHSYVEELVDAGEITADEARVHPNRSVITRALGSDPNMYADHFQIGIETGDRLILCSDGLSSMIPDGEIERIATQSSTAQICTDNLVDAALAAGGSDNVTVVVADLVDDGKLKRESRRRKRTAIIVTAILLVALAIGGIVTFVSITGNVYLGVKDGYVAIYTGVPGRSFMGLNLHWLQDETTVEIEDLPDDTQSRLREGISQESIDAAQETVSKYRKQIYEEQTKLAQSVQTVRSESDEAADASADSSSSSSTDDSAGASADQKTSTQEGGTQ